MPRVSGNVGAGAVDPSRALTRIDPIDPQVPPTPSHPLGRSGVNLVELLATTDAVSTRGPTGAVALEVGLEQARGALLRNLPGDALAALDSVWERARRTEEGWYLRSGALTVLGLPGECDRVAEEGLSLRPSSMALRFVQSVARLALGDSVGARSVLAPALQRAADEPLLVVQHALTVARQGDERGADETIQRLERSTPEHPAVLWGRNALRALLADATRSRSRPTPSDWPTAVGDERIDVSARPRATTPANIDALPVNSEVGTAYGTELGTEFSTDVATAALERFGARVALRPASEFAREARLLLRAFSAGGSMAAATTPEQAHAARIVLTTFLAVAANERPELPSPVRSMVEQITPLLQRGASDDAERVVRKQSVLAREPIGRLLLAVVRGALLTGERPGAKALGATSVATERLSEARVSPDAEEAEHFTAAPSLRHTPYRGVPAIGELLVRDAVDRGPVVPIRLGLSLLEETVAQRAGMPGTSGQWPVVANGSGRDALEIYPMAGDVVGPGSAELSGAGWGAAQAAAEHASQGRRSGEWSDGAGARVVALVCVALAMTALVTGHGAIAIGLGVGAAWMGLRKSGNTHGDGRRE